MGRAPGSDGGGSADWAVLYEYDNVANRANPNTIPTEYFSASYFTEEPEGDGAAGIVILDGEGEPKLFESPVAALTYARKRFEMGEVKSVD
ncbi:MAG: hypothetical protein EOO12_17435 [Chitinophagaceae bacterium]|nr:MAG: hypothetical protein EOO12_17435 [Chitinophagaceae bacterium]